VNSQAEGSGAQARVRRVLCLRRRAARQIRAVLRADEILHKQDRRRWPGAIGLKNTVGDSDARHGNSRRRHTRTVELSKYVQFVIDEKLCAAQRHAKACGMEIGLYHDLRSPPTVVGGIFGPIGSSSSNGCRVAAPPDDFSPKRTGLEFPPLPVGASIAIAVPLYRPSIAKSLRTAELSGSTTSCGSSVFLIPNGLEPGTDPTVRDYAIDLMRILALESVRGRKIS